MDRLPAASTAVTIMGAGLVDYPAAVAEAPVPATTAGEAQWIAEESAARGWGRVVVATSDVHLTRSRVLVERCIETISPSGSWFTAASISCDMATISKVWGA